jgi:hypothetical protein
MKDVRAPVVIDPVIVKLAPYITTMITERVDAAFRPPKKSPTIFCTSKQVDQKIHVNKDMMIYFLLLFCCWMGMCRVYVQVSLKSRSKKTKELTACLSPSFNVSSTFSE